MGKLRAWTVATLLVGCGGSSAPKPPEQPPSPRFVTIEVSGVTIAPGKIDGTHWDMLGKVPPSTWNAIHSALATLTPYASVATVLLQIANEGWDKPDVAGVVELLAGARVERRTFPKVQDSFQPSWASPATFSHVPTDPSVRIRVRLTDVDVANDDPIGEVMLTPELLAPALASGRVHQIQVNDQAPQILFVAVVVRAE